MFPAFCVGQLTRRHVLGIVWLEMGNLTDGPDMGLFLGLPIADSRAPTFRCASNLDPPFTAHSPVPPPCKFSRLSGQTVTRDRTARTDGRTPR